MGAHFKRFQKFQRKAEWIVSETQRVNSEYELIRREYLTLKNKPDRSFAETARMIECGQLIEKKCDEMQKLVQMWEAADKELKFFQKVLEIARGYNRQS